LLIYSEKYLNLIYNDNIVKSIINIANLELIKHVNSKYKLNDSKYFNIAVSNNKKKLRFLTSRNCEMVKSKWM
jgi:hypothetical protein